MAKPTKHSEARAAPPQKSVAELTAEFEAAYQEKLRQIEPVPIPTTLDEIGPPPAPPPDPSE